MRGGKGEKGRKRMRWACGRMLGRDGKGREGLAGGGGIGLWAETRDSQPPKRLKPIWHSCSLLHKTDTYNYPLLFTVLEPKTENKDGKELRTTLRFLDIKVKVAWVPVEGCAPVLEAGPVQVCSISHAAGDTCRALYLASALPGGHFTCVGHLTCDAQFISWPPHLCGSIYLYRSIYLVAIYLCG